MNNRKNTFEKMGEPKEISNLVIFYYLKNQVI